MPPPCSVVTKDTWGGYLVPLEWTEARRIKDGDNKYQLTTIWQTKLLSLLNKWMISGLGVKLSQYTSFSLILLISILRYFIHFYFIDPQNYLHMRTFLNCIKNETLNEIKISLENLWQRTIQLSDFSPNPLVLIPSVAVRYKKSISIIETVISIDYRYIDFLASYFSDRSRGIDRVGDNWRTVNTSANPHISDQLTELRTEYTW